MTMEQQQTMTWAHTIQTRDGTLAKDSKVVNGLFEATENGLAVVKRPGTGTYQTFIGTPQGQFYANGIAYAIVNDVAYSLTDGTAYPIPSVTVAGQQYDCLNDVPPGEAFIKSASGLWHWIGSSTTFTKITDSNYPATTVPGFVYLDGVYYVMRSDGQVLGSALEDGTTWPALDFIQADFTLGTGAGIIRHLNYIVAFYSHGTQMYYDAAAAVNGQGIALAPVQNASWTTGLATGLGQLENADLTFFVAQDKRFGRTINMFNGLEMSVISDGFIEKILNRSTLADVSSFGVKVAGHVLFCFTFADLGVTLVFDIGLKKWTIWTSMIGGNETYFIGRNYLSFYGKDLLQDRVTGNTIYVDPTLYQDQGNAIPVTCVTPNYDFGTENWKRYSGMYLFADTVSTTVTISYSDDDYSTFPVSRTIDLSSVRKMLQRIGRSRRRAFKLTHSDNVPLRLFDTKLDMDVLNG